jgi:purine-nucleoside phosphorylase
VSTLTCAPAIEAERRSVELLAEELRAQGLGGEVLAIVLGSGLGKLSDHLTERRVVPAGALEHLPRSRVSGHAGALVGGRLGGVPVVVQSGRVHLYEGRSALEVTRAVRAFARLGVRGLLLTNASGSLVPEWGPGTFVAIRDHIGLQWRTPLLAGEDRRESPWDAELCAQLAAAAAELEVPLQAGTYAATLGPSYETPAEIRALRALGADVVGMSTVAEACAAHAAGLRVVGVSCVANPAAGITGAVLRHEDVLEVMRASAERLAALVEAVAPTWSASLAPAG